MYEIYNNDCFTILPTIKSNSADLFICDLPYNQTNCSWDKDVIDLDQLWTQLKRIGRQND